MPQPVVAILGASADRRKFGNKSVRAHERAGYQVLPVNPRGGTIEGLAAITSIAELPAIPLNRVSFYLPAAAGLEALRALAERRRTLLDASAAQGDSSKANARPRAHSPDLQVGDYGEIWLNPGADAAEVVALGRQLGLNIVVGCSIVDVGFSPAEFPDE